MSSSGLYIKHLLNSLEDILGVRERKLKPWDTSKAFLIYFILFLAVLGLYCCMGFSLVAVIRGYSLVAVHGLLIVVASLAVEHKL